MSPLTEAAVRAAVATPAVAHLLAGARDESARSFVATGVPPARWTHQDAHVKHSKTHVHVF